MKVILRSTDISFIQSAQIALDAHDIPTVLTSDNATGLPSSPSTLAVRDDQDVDRALTILRGLKRSGPEPWWEARWAPRALLVVFIVLILVLCATLIF